MNIKAYFTGKSGMVFWLNIVLMGVVLVGVPLGAFYALDQFTRHGEKIEVPNVVGSSAFHATEKLEEAGLRVEIADSMYNTRMAPGAVIEQTPRGGSMVKNGRIIYLTINLKGEPMVKFPDIIHNSSLREAEAHLKVLGFSLTPCERVEGQPRDFVVGVRQGTRDLHTGEMVSRDRALTILAGAGVVDSLEMDTLFDVEPESAADFDMDF
jgi:hypothetical protein